MFEERLKSYITLQELFGWMMRRQRKKEIDRVLNKKRWASLWVKACEQAKLIGDPRLPVLERYADSPEKILRKMGIIGMADVEREFNGNK